MGQSDSKYVYTEMFSLGSTADNASFIPHKNNIPEQIAEVFDQINGLNFTPSGLSQDADQATNLAQVIHRAQVIDLTVITKSYLGYQISASDAALKELWAKPNNVLRVLLIQDDWSSLTKIKPDLRKALTDPAVAAFALVGCADAQQIGVKLKRYSDLVTKQEPNFNLEAVLLDSLRQTNLLIAYPQALTAVEAFLSWNLTAVTGQSVWAINENHRPYLKLIKQWLNQANNLDHLAAGNLILTFIRQYHDCPKIFYHILADFVKTQALTEKLVAALQGLLQQTILNQPESIKPSQRLDYHHVLKTPISDDVIDYCIVLYDRRRCHTSETWLINLIEHGHLNPTQLDHIRRCFKGDLMIYRALAVNETNKISNSH